MILEYLEGMQLNELIKVRLKLCRVGLNYRLKILKKSYKEEKIRDGRFGAYMKVDIQNDGPVTILLDSKKEKTQNQDETCSSDKV